MEINSVSELTNDELMKLAYEVSQELEARIKYPAPDLIEALAKAENLPF